MYYTTNSGFGIHTFMLTASLHFEKYRELKLILQKSVWEKKEVGNQSYIKSKIFMTEGYLGVSAKLYMQNGFARIEIIVNPTDLLAERYTQTEIFTHSNSCKKMLKRLNEALKLINMTVYDFTLSRVDLCVNYVMSPAVVETYIKLGRKSYLTQNVYEKQFEDARDNRHSLTLVCLSFEIEMYDKEYEVANRTNEYKLADEYGKILRFEVRLPRDTIYKYVSRWRGYDLRKILSYFIDESQELMKDCFDRAFWRGNYMTLETAKQLIAAQHFKDKTKKLMFAILDSKKPLEERFEDLINNGNYSQKQIFRLKSKFAKCNICPVTITVRASQKCGDFLVGILELFDI
ncbi:MAG: hypothetical protein NC253_01015 [Ruminococcus sp.]|nr:hypothetical protein [Ruminococcus sp.]MCM1382325.1 hypothetical protein [Muribaculaceae bacterium]MCM1480970.1 hypothetical protein [Muribaculaceae bacterium]